MINECYSSILDLLNYIGAGFTIVVCHSLRHHVVWAVKFEKRIHLIYLREEWSVQYIEKAKTMINNLNTFLPLSVHVKLADGYDFPTVHTALKPSVMPTSFLSICKFGSSIGNSTTCIRDSWMSVWNVGASSDTSHRKRPDSSRLTLRNNSVCESDAVT